MSANCPNEDVAELARRFKFLCHPFLCPFFIDESDQRLDARLRVHGYSCPFACSIVILNRMEPGSQREWPQIRCAPANVRKSSGLKRSGTRKSSLFDARATFRGTRGYFLGRTGQRTGHGTNPVFTFLLSFSLLAKVTETTGMRDPACGLCGHVACARPLSLCPVSKGDDRSSRPGRDGRPFRWYQPGL